jgi:class 3 adenylate cyclase/tetratricopeptide (TPR) repeat protein
MVCPSCRHETPTDAAFCPECGAKLGVTCPQCGTANATSHKFCKACGQPLSAASSSGAMSERPSTPQVHIPKHLAERILTSRAALEGERKQVTVLFADLKGSLELLADRDPEEAREILDPVVERMMEAVHRYEGTVNQVMGDGIMAIFGAPLGHEDHAVRACYAALDMQAAIRRYTGEARRSHGIEVQIRVGLNSGEVVVRTIGSDLHMDYSAIGQTTHLASRMEQLATPGTTRLTAETLHLVEGFVEVKPLGPVPVKGLEVPIEVYELVGAGRRRSRLEAAAARGLTRFVGRERELEELRKVLGRAAEGRGQVVAIVGEPGVGKSRLVWEVTHSHRTYGWLIVQAGSVSYGKATLYLPFVDLLKGYFQIQDRHDHREIREKVIGKLLALDEALKPFLPTFLALLDVPVDDPEWQILDPSQRRMRTLEATKRLLLRESQAQPLLVVFEDLHWIDTETQALLDTLVDSLPSTRVVLLVNYRPEYQHDWGSKTYYTQLRLDPLPQESTEEFLNALLGSDPELQSLGRQLMGRTEGNPFFLEESVRTLVETGVLGGEPGAYRLTKMFQPTLVPPTVQAVLAARIDRLPPDEKYLLQAASVIGTDVPFTLLQALADVPDDALRRGLEHLQAAEFIYETSIFPDVEYTFKHALTHEVVYRGLLQERRSALHARAVTALESMYADRLGPHVERMAHHAVQGRLWEQAVRYLRESGVKAAARSAHQEAIKFLERALEVVGRLPETPSTLGDALDLRIALGPSLIALLGAPAAQVEASYQHASDLCNRVNDTSRRFPVLWGLWYSAFAQGRYPTACELGESLLELANASGDSGQLLEGHHALWATFNAMGRPTVTLTHLEQGLALYDRQQHDKHALAYGGHDAGACCHSHLAFTWWLLGYPEKALAHTQAAINLAAQLSHTLTTVITLGYGGLVYWLLADHGAATEAARSVMTLCEEKGLPGFSLDSEVLLARARMEHGVGLETLDALNRRLHDARHARAASRHTFCACLLAEAYGRSGQPDKGLKLLMSLGQGQREALFAPEVHRLEGELLAQTGAQALAEAEKRFRYAIDLARKRNEMSLELRAAMSLACLLEGEDRWAEGRAILAQVYERFTEGLRIGDLGKARLLLEK